jgi:hypothetical protein
MAERDRLRGLALAVKVPIWLLRATINVCHGLLSGVEQTLFEIDCELHGEPIRPMHSTGTVSDVYRVNPAEQPDTFDDFGPANLPD